MSKVASLQVDVRFDSRQEIVISYNFNVLVLSVISGVKTSVDVWRFSYTSCCMVTSWSILVPSPHTTLLAVFCMSWSYFMVRLTLNSLLISYTPAVPTASRKTVRSFARLAELTLWRLRLTWIIFISYRAVDTIHIGYENQSFNAAQGNPAACSDIRTKRINELCGRR